MKRIFLALVAFTAMFCAGVAPSKAAETKPIAAVAIASYNDVLSDVNFVGELIQQPQLGVTMEALLTVVTQGQGLAGIDKTRSSGVIIQAGSEADVSGYIFVPVTDFKQVLGLLKLYTTVEAEGTVYKLTPKDGKKVSYIKEHGAWALLADKPETLAHAAADPTALLKDLKKEYIVGGRIFLSNLPDSLRSKFIGGVKDVFNKEIAKKDDESEQEFAQRKKALEQIEPYMVRVVNDLDQVILGWGLDRSAEKTFLDVSVTAKPGTETAAEMALAAKATSCLGGFHLPGAAMSTVWAGTISAAKQEIAASLIDAVQGKALAEIAKKTPEDKLAAAKEVVADVSRLLQKIVKGGHVDGAASVLVNPKAATAVVGGYVADGALLDKILHTIAKSAIDDHPEIQQFVKLDAEKSGEVNFHEISIPIPLDANDREKVVQLVGENLDIIIGVGKEKAYLAVGRNAKSTLKKAIERSDQVVQWPCRRWKCRSTPSRWPHSPLRWANRKIVPRRNWRRRN